MELYSKIKLVRKKADSFYSTPGALAYHIGYVIRVGAGKDYRYADVYLISRKTLRLIRMYFNGDENNKHMSSVHENCNYVYYDNDNNTKLYFHKQLTEMNDKDFNLVRNLSGVHYEIDKITTLEEITDFSFFAKIQDERYLCLHQNSDLADIEYGHELFDETQEELRRRGKLGLSLYAMMGCYSKEYINKALEVITDDKNATHFAQILGYCVKNNPYIITQLLPQISSEYLEKLNKLNEDKMQMVKTQNYAEAAILRDEERQLLDQIKLESLFTKIKK